MTISLDTSVAHHAPCRAHVRCDLYIGQSPDHKHVHGLSGTAWATWISVAPMFVKTWCLIAWLRVHPIHSLGWSHKVKKFLICPSSYTLNTPCAHMSWDSSNPWKIILIDGFIFGNSNQNCFCEMKCLCEIKLNEKIGVMPLSSSNLTCRACS